MKNLITLCGCLLFTAFPLLAQQPFVPDYIDVKKRLLLRERDEHIEQVDSFQKLHLIIAGNIYQPEPQIKIAFDPKKGRYDFSKQLKYIQPILNLGDVVIGNLKTSFTGDMASAFSSPDELALALKYAGFTVLADADINSAYITKDGVQRTKKLLNDLDILHTGVYTDNVQRVGNCPLLFTKRGFRIAVLNFTNPINNPPAASKEFIINQTDRTRIELDIRLARTQQADFIIMYLDWGANFQTIPSNLQQDFARWCLERGCHLVVGTHPNRPMPVDVVEYYYAGKETHALVAYSLGNLIGGSDDDYNKSGFLIDAELTKNTFTGETQLTDYGIIPCWNYYDTTSVKGKSQLYVVPCSNVEEGLILPDIPYIQKRKCVNAAFEMRKMLGTTCEEIQYNLTEKASNDVEEFMLITNAPLNNKFSMMRPEKIVTPTAPINRTSAGIVPDTLYRIQFYMLKKLIPIDTNYYDHLKGYEVLEENGYYIYLLGNTTDFDALYSYWLRQMKPRYKTSFIAVYVDGRKIREITATDLKGKP